MGVQGTTAVDHFQSDEKPQGKVQIAKDVIFKAYITKKVNQKAMAIGIKFFNRRSVDTANCAGELRERLQQ